jgi:hypothetical protein
VTELAPLDDPRYEPKHPPRNGCIPSGVERWGARSQVRWFNRFFDSLIKQQEWARYYVFSTQHTGSCCSSCLDDVNEGYEPYDADRCCCRAERPPV